MANRKERRAAESKLRVQRRVNEKNDRALQLEETLARSRRAASVGASIGEMPDGRGVGPQHGEIK